MPSPPGSRTVGTCLGSLLIKNEMVPCAFVEWEHNTMPLATKVTHLRLSSCNCWSWPDLLLGGCPALPSPASGTMERSACRVQGKLPPLAKLPRSIHVVSTCHGSLTPGPLATAGRIMPANGLRPCPGCFQPKEGPSPSVVRVEVGSGLFSRLPEWAASREEPGGCWLVTTGILVPLSQQTL